MRSLPALVLSACLALPTGAEDYSRHCKGPADSQALIVDGTYKGSWQLSVTFKQTLNGYPLIQTIQGRGEFQLKVDRGSFSFGQAANASKLQGQLKSSSVMHMDLPQGATADQKLEGGGPMELDGPVDPAQFKATVQHAISGQISVTHPRAAHSEGQSFSDTVKLTFLADQGGCDGASGTLQSDSLEEMILSMTSVGYTAERQGWTWTMARVPEDGDPIAKFKEELARKAPSGIHRTREAEATRLGKLADRIKNDEPDSVKECLFKLWSEHVVQQYLAWAQEDTQKLTGYKGDWSGLQEYVKRALETDRALCLMGLDTCAAEVHQQLWNAVQSALADYLTRMAQGQASMARLLEALKQAQLLGAVSPGLEAKVWEAIQAQAKERADATYQAFRSAVAAARSAHRDPATDGTVKAAAGRAILAEKAAKFAGVDHTQSTELAASIGLV